MRSFVVLRALAVAAALSAPLVVAACASQKIQPSQTTTGTPDPADPPYVGPYGGGLGATPGD